MSAALDTEALLDLVRGEHANVVAALERSTTRSQAGVLGAGELLGDLVSERQGVATHLEQSLTAVEGEHAPKIRAAVSSQADLAADYVAEVSPLWEETLALVSEALQCASEINLCATRVAQVSKAMGILQMCCKSEIAHLGQAAISFESTVLEMKSLTTSTDDLNRRLERLAKEMSTELPPIASLGGAERRRTRAFGKALTQSLSQVEQASEALVERVAESLEANRGSEEVLVQASFRALSALQFQDPLVQDLQRCDSRLGELSDILEGHPPDETSFIAYEANIGDKNVQISQHVEVDDEDDALDSGDFLLF